MKRVLITAAHSYIGDSLERYLGQWPDRYETEKISLRNCRWETLDFSAFDSVVHVAGIAHRKETAANRWEYAAVNRDLAIEVARRAKRGGVGQFVFLSTMNVYGIETGVITKETVPSPVESYGISKLEAERGIWALNDENFHTAILRPPMVYGYGCRGNFQALVRLVRKLPVFPLVRNRRSMVYIGVLCAFIRHIVDLECAGVFFPQNSDYISTSELAESIAAACGKRLFFSRLAGLAVGCALPFSKTLRKAFGSLVYEGMEEPAGWNCPVDAARSVRESVPPSGVESGV